VDNKSIIDADVTIRSGVRIENSVIGRNCKIEEGAHIIDSVIWPGNTLDSGSRVEGAIIGKGCYVGRFVTLRPGVVLGDKTAATDYSQL
jgi:NDP-sugar pyrophosphorylase family protein